MSRRESYLTFPDQKDANARFYTRVGTPKYLITKPIENQVNIVTTLVTRIKTWKLRNQWKVLFLCLVLYTFILDKRQRLQSNSLLKRTKMSINCGV